MNLIDLELTNINIEISNANCEDGLNIVRSKGTINKLKILNSSNDALDIDFSNINILKQIFQMLEMIVLTYRLEDTR